jgi:hypothetical protein
MPLAAARRAIGFAIFPDCESLIAHCEKCWSESRAFASI